MSQQNDEPDKNDDDKVTVLHTDRTPPPAAADGAAPEDGEMPSWRQADTSRWSAF